MNENRNFEHTYFERLLKEKTDEFVLYPSKRVWHGIYNSVHPGRKWPSISMSIILLSILLIIGFLNNPINNSTTIQNNAKAEATIAVISKPVAPNASQLNINRVSSILPILATENIISNPRTPVAETLADLAESKSFVSQQSVIKKGNFTVSTEAAIIENASTSNAQIDLIANAIDNNTSNNITALAQNSNPNATKVLSENIAPLLSTEANSFGLTAMNDNKPLSTADAAQTDKSAKEITIETHVLKNQQLLVNKAIETGDLSYLSTYENESQKLIASESLTKQTFAISANITNENFEPVILKAKVFRNNNALPTIAALNGLKLNSLETSALHLLSETDKSWIKHYALYHRAAPKKWKGKLEWQQYITPSVVYRTLQNNAADQLIAAQNYLVSRVDNSTLNNMVNQSPNIGLEAGVGLRYPLSKSLKAKVGLQLNFSRYTIHAFDNAHPIATSITLNDNNANQPPYQVYKTTTYSNLAGIQPVNLHNTSLQLAIPLGFDYKVWGNNRIKWYVSSTIQPSVVLLGRNYLLSTDQRNYVRDNDLMNRFNLHAGFETFLAFEKKGYTLQVGPQFRQQIFTTNTRLYTIEERIQQFGFKVGITRKR